ncbi:hypothetical protein N0V85_009901, partial [Neurospora sp. IMI 360204]
MKKDCRAPKQLKWKKAEAAAVEGARVVEIASAEYGQDDLEDAMDRAMDCDLEAHWEADDECKQDEPDEEDPKQEEPRGAESHQVQTYRAPTWEEVSNLPVTDRSLLTAVHVMCTTPPPAPSSTPAIEEHSTQDFTNPYQYGPPNNFAAGRWTDPLEHYLQK